MASPKIVSAAVSRSAADAAHAEITQYIDLRSPDVVQKQLDKVLSLDKYLKSPELQSTNTLVEDFLNSIGRKLAADFLQVQNAKLERSFLVLYCAREIKKINKGLGKVTIFLALGRLSLDNGLPKVGNDPSCEDLISGDAILVGSDTPQVLDKNMGGGFALVSDWSA